MKIELTVDGAQVSDDVRELLDNLTQEQKREMALQLMKDCMSDVNTRFNKRVAIDEAIETLNLENEEYQFRWVTELYLYHGNL